MRVIDSVPPIAMGMALPPPSLFKRQIHGLQQLTFQPSRHFRNPGIGESGASKGDLLRDEAVAAI